MRITYLVQLLEFVGINIIWTLSSNDFHCVIHSLIPFQMQWLLCGSRFEGQSKASRPS